MAESFWRLQEPEYDSEDEFYRHNGSLEHPFGLPGVTCDVCGRTWGGSRVLPFACPIELRERTELLNRWPIPGPQHRSLREEVAALLRAEGHSPPTLLPGDGLQPGYLNVPSAPPGDFLWASLGSVVVSRRMRDLLAALAGSHVEFVAVTPRSISPGLSKVGDYFEMIVLAESGLPHGVPELITCAGCQRPSYDDSARVLRMFPDMWRGAPIFLLATTLLIVVTEDVRRALDEAGASNVAFAPAAD